MYMFHTTKKNVAKSEKILECLRLKNYLAFISFTVTLLMRNGIYYQVTESAFRFEPKSSIFLSKTGVKLCFVIFQ